MHPLVQRVIDRTPRPLRPGVDLVLRTVNDSIDDRVPGLAAEIAFYVLLSLPPLLLTFLGAIGYLGGDLERRLADFLINAASTVFADTTVNDVVRPTVDIIVDEGRADVISIGFLITVWTASRAMKVILTGITIAYDLRDHRPGWKQRLWGLGLTFAAIVLGILLTPVLLAGPSFGNTLAGWIGNQAWIETAWQLVYWPIATVIATALLALLYHIGAPWSTPWRRDLPGAVLAMLLWLAGSFGLRLYARNTFQGDQLYDQLAAPLAILLWLYITGFAVLLGAELNAEIEKKWPAAKPRWQPGEMIRKAARQASELAKRTPLGTGTERNTATTGDPQEEGSGTHPG